MDVFLSKLLVSLLCITITAGIIFIIRHLFRTNLSSQWRYRLWYLFIVSLLLPFLPIQPILNFTPSFSIENAQLDSGTAEAVSSNQLEQNGWIADLGISVSRVNNDWLNLTAYTIWGVGALLFLIVTLRSMRQIRNLIRTSSPVKSQLLKTQYYWCLEKVGIRPNIHLLETSLIQSPIVLGLFKTYLILPKGLDQQLAEVEIRHVLMHELQHVKLHHPKTNTLFVLFQLIYWFHPLVWKAFKSMRLDREIVCDAAVITSLGINNKSSYGHTMLRFFELKNAQPKFMYISNEFGGEKSQLKERIKHIASFQMNKKNGVFIFLGLSLLFCGQIPLIATATVTESTYNFDDRHAVYEDMNEYFEGKSGSFVLFSEAQNQYIIHNKEGSTKRVSPNSTFKPFSALIGLDLDVMDPETTYEWNGHHYEHEEWNQNHNLTSAMHYSVNWYFEEIEEDIQYETMQQFINKINYGNQWVSDSDEPFWLESTLKISPIEQVEQLRALDHNSFSFQEESVHEVKNAIKLSEDKQSTLYGKTGTGIVNQQAINGWFIGFVETPEDTWYFATNIQGDEDAWGYEAANVTYRILEGKEIYKGGIENE